MELNSLNPGEGAVRTAKRLGRGPGSGFGKTSGRGQKGAGARKSSHKGRVRFEGGQMPLIQRLPKRGFVPPFQKEVQVVQLAKLAALGLEEVSVAEMIKNGLVRKSKVDVKVLGGVELDKAMTVQASAFSASARDAIEKAGGKAEIV